MALLRQVSLESDNMFEPLLDLSRMVVLDKILKLPENQMQKLVKEMEMAINTNVTKCGDRIKVHNTEVRANVIETILYWDLLKELKTLGLIQIEDKLTRYSNRMLENVLQLPKIQQQVLFRKMHEDTLIQISERIQQIQDNQI